MKAEPIATILLRGSRNIDLMRQEITGLTKLLIGIIFADDLLDVTPEEFRVRGQSGEWRLRKKSYHRGTPCVTKVIITYCSIAHGSGAENWVYSSEPDDNRSSPRMESVQPMWRDLPALVEGVVETIPEIKGFRWETLAKAAEENIA